VESFIASSREEFPLATRFLFRTSVALALLAFLSVASGVHASEMQFSIATRFDAGQPGNPTGHLELTFDDNGGLAAGHIKLTVQAVGFDSTENVDDLFLNFGPNPPSKTLDPSKLTISQLSGIANTGIKHGVGNKPGYCQ
jgi:hypothetical protein